MAGNNFNQPLLLSVTAAAFTLVAMGGLFLGPSIVECSPDGENIASNNIASCLLVDLNERLPLTEALTPLIEENVASSPDLQTEIIEPPVPEAEPEEVAPQEAAVQEAELQVAELQEAELQVAELQEPRPQDTEPERSIPEPALPEVVQPEVVQSMTVQSTAVQSAAVQSMTVQSAEVGLENLPEAEVAPDRGVEEIAITEPQNDDTPTIEPIAILEIAIPEIITPTDVVPEIAAQEPAEQEPEQQETAEQETVQLESEQMETEQMENVRQELVRQEFVQQIVAPAPVPAPTINKSITLPTIDAVEIDGELNFIAGAGEEGLKIRLFVDNELTGTSIVAGGRWLVEAQNILDASSSQIRADMLELNSNDLLARTQVNFELETPEVDINPVELEGPQDVSALPVNEQAANVEMELVEESAPTIMSIDIAPLANIAASSNIASSPDSDVTLSMDLISAPIDNPVKTALLEAEPPKTELLETVLGETIPPEAVLPETVLPATVVPATVVPATVLPKPSPLESTIITPDPVERVIPITLPNSEQIILSEENVAKEISTEETTTQDLDQQDLSVQQDPIVEDEITKETNIEIVEREVLQVDGLQVDGLQVEVFETEEIISENFEAGQQETTPIALAAIAPQSIQTNIVAEPNIKPGGETNIKQVLDIPAAETTPVENEKIVPREQAELIEPQSNLTNTLTLRAVIVGDPEESRFTSGKVIIRTGDNLWTIANRVYGMGRRYVEIYEANIGQISNPHWIFPGQIFDLPEN